MATRTISLTDPLYDYLLDVSLREHPSMAALRAETASLAERECQMSPDQAQFMGMLAKLMGARRALEIGVFTGYSALAVALALPEDGELIACDVSHEWTRRGRPYWEQAGVAHKIDLRLAPALETLDALLADSTQHNSFDFAFIDADKPNYPRYYEQCLTLVRPGGLITIDNVLWSGGVIDPARQDESTRMFRKFNADLAKDERIDISLVAIGDGLTLARKR
jgi:predicted O-methyltransferase YrrM